MKPRTLLNNNRCANNKRNKNCLRKYFATSFDFKDYKFSAEVNKICHFRLFFFLRMNRFLFSTSFMYDRTVAVLSKTHKQTMRYSSELKNLTDSSR